MQVAAKRSEVPWVADEETWLQGQVRAGKAKSESEKRGLSPSPGLWGTGIKAPFPEVWWAEAGNGWVHKCVCLLESG